MSAWGWIKGLFKSEGKKAAAKVVGKAASKAKKKLVPAKKAKN